MEKNTAALLLFRGWVQDIWFCRSLPVVIPLLILGRYRQGNSGARFGGLDGSCTRLAPHRCRSLRPCRPHLVSRQLELWWAGVKITRDWLSMPRLPPDGPPQPILLPVTRGGCASGDVLSPHERLYLAALFQGMPTITRIIAQPY
jgi:hypothetical protein